MNQCFSSEIVRRAAFDVGSGKTKLLIADVDIATDRVIQVVHSEFIRLKFSEDLAKKGSDTLSQAIQEDALREIEKLKEKAILLGAKEFSGIATEVFRKAKNGQMVLDLLKEELGISLHIISQEEEAALGLISLAQTMAMKADDLVAIDHGSGSFQITGKEKGEVVSYQGKLGTVPLTEMLLKIQEKSYDAEHSPNPVTLKEILHFNDSIHNILPGVPDWIQNKVANATVFAGHSDISGTIGICFQATKKTNFSREELWEAIVSLVGKTDAEINELLPEATPTTVFPRLLFIYNIMTKLNISQINWFPSKSGSAIGVLITPSFWEKTGVVL